MDKGFHNLTRIMATVSLVSDTVNREEEDDLIEQLVDAADAKFLSEADMRRLNRISIATMTSKLTITERDEFLQWVDEKSHYLRRMLNNMYREMADSSYEAPDLHTMLLKHLIYTPCYIRWKTSLNQPKPSRTLITSTPD